MNAPRSRGWCVEVEFPIFNQFLPIVFQLGIKHSAEEEEPESLRRTRFGYQKAFLFNQIVNSALLNLFSFGGSDFFCDFNLIKDLFSQKVTIIWKKKEQLVVVLSTNLNCFGRFSSDSFVPFDSLLVRKASEDLHFNL